MTTKCELTDDMGERTRERERERGAYAREMRDGGDGERGNERRGDMSHG